MERALLTSPHGFGGLAAVSKLRDQSGVCFARVAIPKQMPDAVAVREFSKSGFLRGGCLRLPTASLIKDATLSRVPKCISR